MIINIKGTDHELKFGIRFVRELDKKHYMMADGMRYGVGVLYLVQNLQIANILSLTEGIAIAARISEKVAEEYIESIEDEVELEVLIEDFLHALKKAPVTGLQVRKGEEKAAAHAKLMAKQAKQASEKDDN